MGMYVIRALSQIRLRTCIECLIFWKNKLALLFFHMLFLEDQLVQWLQYWTPTFMAWVRIQLETFKKNFVDSIFISAVFIVTFVEWRTTSIKRCRYCSTSFHIFSEQIIGFFYYFFTCRTFFLLQLLALIFFSFSTGFTHKH